MPVVGAVLGAVFGAVGSAVAAVATTIAAVIAPIVGAVSAVITPIVSGIAGVLSTITGPILAPITKITDALLGPLGESLNVLGAAVLLPVKEILGPLGEGIKTITGTITDATAPVLGPIRDTMETIHALVYGVQGVVVEGLEPVRDIATLVREFSTAKLTVQLLAGTEDLSRLVGLVADEAGIQTAGAIATMWKDTVDVAVSLSTIVDDHVALVRGEIDTLGERLTQEQETALAQARAQIDHTVASLESRFIRVTTGIEREVRLARSKVENVSYFREMMIKGLA